jgi:hypothetical protein
VGAALPRGWAATAHPFRAADPGSGAGPGGDRLFGRHRRRRPAGQGASRCRGWCWNEQDDYRDQTKHPTMARLGRFGRYLPRPGTTRIPSLGHAWPPLQAWPSPPRSWSPPPPRPWPASPPPPSTEPCRRLTPARRETVLRVGRTGCGRVTVHGAHAGCRSSPRRVRKTMPTLVCRTSGGSSDRLAAARMVACGSRDPPIQPSLTWWRGGGEARSCGDSSGRAHQGR